MASTLLGFSVLLWVATPPTPSDRLISTLPRLAGKSDVILWHRVQPDRIVRGTFESILVRADTEEAVTRLRREGIKTSIGSWVSAYLPSSRVLGLLKSPASLHVRESRAHRPYLERSSVEMGVDLVHEGQGLDTSRTGKGVLIGVIDTGVDYAHPAFMKDGRSRVVAIWDQDAADGNAPKRFGYGHQCTQLDIRLNDCSVGDPDGHGTHVAGIVAGAGPVRGMAPDAQIAVVRSQGFNRLADAVRYLTDLADARGQPIVINVSVGGQYGPHDGQTPLEKYLEDMVGEGRIIVAAAGNDGSAPVHVHAELAPEAQRVVLQGLPHGKQVDSVVEAWTEPDAQTELALELWVDGKLRDTLKLHANRDSYVEYAFSHEETFLGEVLYGIDYVSDHDLVKRTLLLDRSGAEALPDGWFLALSASGSGSMHAWASQTAYGVGQTRFGESLGKGWLAGDGRASVAVPASSVGAIAVGAYTTRGTWVDENARLRGDEGALLGDLALFSSRGPTFKPELTGVKPEVAAPGSVIVSARARVVPPSSGTLDENRMVMQGTSMSAPHVTGVVALMLEANPMLSPQALRNALQSTSRVDAFTGDVPNDSWGYGKIDAQALLSHVELNAPQGCQSTGAGGLLWLVIFGVSRVRKRHARRDHH